MPHCTVRYNVRLTPKVADVPAMDAIGVFYEERSPDITGAPGNLVSRRLTTFSGPTGYELKHAVTRELAWAMAVGERIGPLQWDE